MSNMKIINLTDDNLMHEPSENLIINGIMPDKIKYSLEFDVFDAYLLKDIEEGEEVLITYGGNRYIAIKTGYMTLLITAEYKLT